jgi:hypothetical protein
VFLKACNVLRMVKLFGWESEMHERIAVRREDEVKWLWKRKIYDMIISIVKSVFHPTKVRVLSYTSQLFDTCIHNDSHLCVTYDNLERRTKRYVSFSTSSATVINVLDSGQSIFKYGSFYTSSSISLDVIPKAFAICRRSAHLSSMSYNVDSIPCRQSIT